MRPESPAAPRAPRPPARPTYPWAPPAERGQATREVLTRDQIVETALRLVDAEGLGALSMRRLGQELDAGATSLYWHIRNKDELLDLLLDRIIAEVVAETPIGSDDWRATAMDAARTFRRVLLRHRNVTPVMGARPTLGPSALRGMDTIIGIFIDAGFDPREAVLAANAIVNWAAGFAVFEARQPLGINATPEEQAGYLEDYNGFLASLPRDEYPMMTHMATVMAECTPDVQFEYALERLLDGIEAQRAVPGAPA